MLAEFPERTYEAQFGNELARLTNQTFMPSLCDELFLGFDSGFFLDPYQHRWIFPYRRWSRLDHLIGVSRNDFDKEFEHISRRMPPFRMNLFAQFKRPNYLRTRGAAQWSDWNCAYYRYEITSHQQLALERIQDMSRGRSAAIYASPAFWKNDDLWNYVERQLVVANSNIASAELMRGHNIYTYSQSGSFGKAHSEPEDIESPSLQNLIESGLEQEELLLNLHIKESAKVVMKAIREEEISYSLFESARRALGIPDFNGNSILSALETMDLLQTVFDIEYFAIR